MRTNHEPIGRRLQELLPLTDTTTFVSEVSQKRVVTFQEELNTQRLKEVTPRGEDEQWGLMKRGSTFIAETISAEAKVLIRQSIAAQNGERTNIRESAIVGSSDKRKNLVEEARRQAAAIARQALQEASKDVDDGGNEDVL